MKSIVYLISVLFLLSACGPASTPIQPTVTEQQRPDVTLDIATIKKLSQPTRSIRAIYTAQKHFDAENYGQASELLGLIDLSVVSRPTQKEILTLAGLMLGKPAVRQQVENWIANQKYNTASTETAELRIQAELALNDTTKPAAELWLSLAEKPDSHPDDTGRIWQAIKTLRSADLNTALLNYQPQGNAAGWLQLVGAYQNNTNGIKQNQGSLQNWLSEWPQHPAATDLPDDIQLLLTSLEIKQGTAVAVLPLSGKLAHIGEALQAAMIAAHSHAPQFETLLFIDQNKYGSADDINFEINNLNADYILGPIDKPTLEAIANSPLRSAPQVALNTLSNEVDSTTALTQLSLRIEDEARFVAELHEEGYTHALILSSQNALAQRASNEYIAAWEQNPEHYASVQTFTDAVNFSEEIKQALLIDESHTRLRTIEDIFIQRMENNLRRREDISHIFLSATPAEARAIKPLLPYHFAGDLPIFSPSLVFDGAIESEKNRDISNILFVDTPWAINPADPLKQKINQHIRRGGNASKNLHALAIDSYFIAAYQYRLSPEENWVFKGRTGDTLIHKNGTTERNPVAATVNGKYAQAVILE